MSSEIINNRNVLNIREQIEMKKCSNPYYATEAIQVVTDYDHFPYTRFYKGEYNNSQPIVAEREAGWRKLENNCYKMLEPITEPFYPNHCFQSACSTVYPCYPQYLRKYADKEALEVMLNNSCIVSYR